VALGIALQVGDQAGSAGASAWVYRRSEVPPLRAAGATCGS